MTEYHANVKDTRDGYRVAIYCDGELLDRRSFSGRIYLSGPGRRAPREALADLAERNGLVISREIAPITLTDTGETQYRLTEAEEN